MMSINSRRLEQMKAVPLCNECKRHQLAAATWPCKATNAEYIIRSIGVAQVQAACFSLSSRSTYHHMLAWHDWVFEGGEKKTGMGWVKLLC